MTSEELKDQIDADITVATLPNSVSTADVGGNMKDIVDYVDQEKRPYKVYSARITQSGTSAPTVLIYENTIGNIAWTRGGAGDYYGTLISAFVNNKTMIPNGEAILQSDGSAVASGYRLYRMNDNAVNLQTKQNNISADSILGSGIDLEIRVYN